MLSDKQIWALNELGSCGQSTVGYLGLDGPSINDLAKMNFVVQRGVNIFGHPLWRLTRRGEQFVRQHRPRHTGGKTIERSER